MGRENGGGGGSGGLSGSDFAGLGLQFAISVLLFLYVGNRVDLWLGTRPVFLIAGVFLGAGAAFYSMYRKVSAAQRASRPGPRAGGDGGGGE